MPKLTNIPDSLKELADELDEKKALAALSDSEGGQMLAKALRTDARNNLERILSGYRTLPHLELIALCSALESSLNTYRVLSRAKTLREELAAILEDELEKL